LIKAEKCIGLVNAHLKRKENHLAQGLSPGQVILVELVFDGNQSLDSIN